jgi:hypothetical protein
VVIKIYFVGFFFCFKNLNLALTLNISR